MDTINIGYQRIDQLIFEIKLNENYILIGEDILQDENLVNKFLKWMFGSWILYILSSVQAL